MTTGRVPELYRPIFRGTGQAPAVGANSWATRSKARASFFRKASGWPPTDVPSGGVDALGVTLDKDGNLFFGLGTPDYSNAYRLKDGKPRYDIQGERGTVLKLSPDRSRREVVATGIRFPVRR